jgi:hypothetical protein
MSDKPSQPISPIQTHRTITSLRNALRSIIFNEGECSRQDEAPYRGRYKALGNCGECPVCIAKAALQGEGDWRFEGYNPERQRSMPRELAMVAAWRRYFERVAGNADGSTMPMDFSLARILFGNDDPNAVTERDWYIATTVVQWLATNVGQSVLADAGYVYREPSK